MNSTCQVNGSGSNLYYNYGEKVIPKNRDLMWTEQSTHSRSSRDFRNWEEFRQKYFEHKSRPDSDIEETPSLEKTKSVVMTEKSNRSKASLSDIFKKPPPAKFPGTGVQIEEIIEDYM